MAKQLIVLVGPPGSGKTTWAENFIYDKVCREGDESWWRISQDDQGKDKHLQLFEEFLKKEQNIIIDRMNFSKKQRNRYVNQAKQQGYRIKIIVFHVSAKECLYRCLERNNHPTIDNEDSAKNAISHFFKYYHRVDDSEADEVVRLGWKENDIKPEAIIVDLDGTLSNSSGRIHYLKEEKKNWDNFYSELINDSVNYWCLDIVDRFASDHVVLFVTGRPEDKCKDLTTQWLYENKINLHDDLIFRPSGVFKPDFEVKQMLYEFEIKPYYDVKFVLEDRQRVVNMWRNEGLVALQCADTE